MIISAVKILNNPVKIHLSWQILVEASILKIDYVVESVFNLNSGQLLVSTESIDLILIAQAQSEVQTAFYPYNIDLVLHEIIYYFPFCIRHVISMSQLAELIVSPTIHFSLYIQSDLLLKIYTTKISQSYIMRISLANLHNNLRMLLRRENIRVELFCELFQLFNTAF